MGEKLLIYLPESGHQGGWTVVLKGCFRPAVLFC